MVWYDRIFTRVIAAAARTKGFSLLPMQEASKNMISPAPRPSDQQLLRAYGENPWLHIKLVRQCSAIAGLGFKVVARDMRTGKTSPLTYDYPLWALLRKPNPVMSGWDFRFLSELYVRVQGEVYWRVQGGGLAPQALWVYPRHWVQPIYRRGGVLERYILTAQIGGLSVREEVPPQQMIWLRVGDPLSPYVEGLGDVLSLATEIDTYELASESDRRFFKHDAQPPGALIVPGMPTTEERNRLLDDWQKRVNPEGVAEGNIPILAGGLDYKQFRVGRREMDFIEGQIMLRDFILSGVHKHIVGISDDVTFANAKAADYTFSHWDIRPRVIWWADNLNEQLAPRYDARAVVEFDNPVPQDEAFELEKATKGLQFGALKRKDWLKINGYPEVPEEEGNVYLLPLSTIEVPADRAGDTEANRPPAPPAAQAPRQEPAPDKPKPANERPAPGREAVQVVPKVPDTPEGVTAPAVIPDRVTKQLTPAQITRIIGGLDDESRAVMDRLVASYRETFKGRWEDAAAELGIESGFDVSDARVFAYIREGAYPRIVGATETTFHEIHRQLEEGTKAGEDISRLSQRVSNVFGEAKGFRSTRIARHESLHASNAAALNAYQASGAVEKVEWLLAPDYDPGEDDGECAELDGVIVNIGDSFGGTGAQYPPLHIQCRCAIAPVLAEPTATTEVTEPHRVEPTEDMVNYADYTPTIGSPIPLAEKEGKRLADAMEKLRKDLARASRETGAAAMENVFKRAMEKDVFPVMQTYLPKDKIKPHLANFYIRDVKTSFHDPLSGDLVLSRAKWDTIKDKLIGIGPAQFDTRELAHAYDAIWHELSHAIQDGGAYYDFGMYNYRGGNTIIEGLNQQLGAKFGSTMAKAQGYALEGEAATFMKNLPVVYADGAAMNYPLAVQNIRDMMNVAGINPHDERNLARALHSVINAPGMQEPRVRTPSGRLFFQDQAKIRENFERVFDAMYAEFKTEFEKAGVTRVNLGRTMHEIREAQYDRVIGYSRINDLMRGAFVPGD